MPHGVSDAALEVSAPRPAQGRYARGFGPVAKTFAKHLALGKEVGAGVTVFHRGRCVVDVWGGVTDLVSRRPWERDSRAVVFSATKGFLAMAMHLLADQGRFEWDAPIATYWPGFNQNGKGGISVRSLFNHLSGLPYLDEPLTLEQCVSPSGAAAVLNALEAQAPAWVPGARQGYHAITYGMYGRELFERIAGEPLGPFLRRELLEPLGSDVHVGAPAHLDPLVSTLYPPPTPGRVARMLVSSVIYPGGTEARIAKATVGPASLQRRAFLNPAVGKAGVTAYNEPNVRYAALAWASATASAHGLARGYLPFASGGIHAGRSYFAPETIAPVYRRQGWSECDAILQKPLGWSQGFLKEERHLFSPTPQSFGHAGMGGALGWCDPVHELTFGYVMNRMDWRVRSPRAVALCRALYECEPIIEAA